VTSTATADSVEFAGLASYLELLTRVHVLRNPRMYQLRKGVFSTGQLVGPGRRYLIR
jgi:hypothetical protein